MPPGLQVDKELSQSDLDKASGSHCPGLRELQVTPPSVPTSLSPGTSPVVPEGFLVPPGHVNTTQCDCLFSSFLNFILAETRQSQWPSLQCGCLKPERQKDNVHTETPTTHTKESKSTHKHNTVTVPRFLSCICG